MDVFLQQLINGLVLGSIYALVALGYTMVYGIIGLINFAHGDIVMVGALIAWTVCTALAATAAPAPLILLSAIGAAMVVCMALGVTIERVAYRPLRRSPRLAPLITAIGMSILLQYTAALIWSKQYLAMPQILQPTLYAIAGATFTDLQAFIFLLACALMAALAWFIKRTKLGKAMRATEQNRDVAGLMGIDVDRIIAFTFLLGSGLGAIAGVMVILYYGIGHYFMGFMLGLKAFTAAVLGGIGKVNGAMLGGMLLGVVEALASGYIGDLTGGWLGSNYRDIFAFLVLVLVLVLRPSGLIGGPPSERA
ncbi:MAG: branched-chain amino acid ABC transporter permease [Azospira oryzae]|uniref:Branched-chain amino acid ABC transporter permease n=1 Tax=Pelomicrobium methylotrophicum TaxID=2602750 RepID=A0A5C7EGA6_9PROT|nr:branched-chain amino acid ABC transporter permease [Pelomicrobium methylotrophicum]PZP57243.1 MAG: branched-chain amino acid ABC transporter permease [Azospira oryzae]PZP78929.1 MAG: branched-chain amino acid ABC transporter permease [Azospira oryzae]TXF10989.1 branched-chain amino acid ABC transporter permease [Pelomicrobium methylotrophicum]